jgi:Lipocalin-like domain
MKRPSILATITASLLLISLALFTGNAAAQGAKSLVGTWTIVSTNTVDAAGTTSPTFGPNPRGSLIFTSHGRYSLTFARASLPKFTAGSREKGTADENQAVVAGSLSHFGKYTVDEKGKSLTFHVETSTYPNWDGTSQKRPFTVSGDELKYTTAAASGGGSAEIVWRRIK